MSARGGYIYQAALWCANCGNAISARLTAEGKAPEDALDSDTYDSNDFPKPVDVSGESDTPEHCNGGSECLNPTIIGGSRYGCFLANDLTSDGAAYVLAAHADRPSEVTRFWAEHYDLLCGDPCAQAEDHPCGVCGLKVRRSDCDGKGRHEDCADGRSL